VVFLRKTPISPLPRKHSRKGYSVALSRDGRVLDVQRGNGIKPLLRTVVESDGNRSRRPKNVRRPKWSVELIEAVRRLREEFPALGKAKLVVLVRERGFEVSESTVGRILAHFKRWGVLKESVKKVKVRPVSSWRSSRERARFRFAVCRSMERASFAETSSERARSWDSSFLCCRRDPQKLNGAVERLNRTFQEELWTCCDGDLTLQEMRPWLKELTMEVYNEMRPHQSLGYVSPGCYLETLGTDRCVV